MLLERNQKHFLKKLWKQNRVIEALLTYFFEKSSKYVGVSILTDKTSKKPWVAKLRIDGKLQYLGCFKTEMEAAKCVNCVCKKHSMELKNPELSDEEENFTWSLPTKEVAMFLYLLFSIAGLRS